MPTLKLRFPGGRYHATPWGHHVNEGLIEWPPSPWRLLRALIASGFSGQGWTELPACAHDLINKLSKELPSYRLPKTSAAHSRHFMPVGMLAKGREQTTLVFDTWANVGDGEMFIQWPSVLNEEEGQMLERLATSLGYLGRSESWAEVELVPENAVPSADLNAFPHREGAHAGKGYEQVALMAPIPPEDYREWREQQVGTALAALPLSEGKRKPTAKLLREREKAIAPYPPDLLSCLLLDTASWKQHGWSQPPGSQRVLYWRPSDSLQVAVPKPVKSRKAKRITTMLLSLTTPSGSRSALPSCTRTLPQAELFHRAIVGRLAKGRSVDCPELTGKDETGGPLRDNHAHAHTLPVDLDGDGRLDHLLVYAAMGLGEAAQHAIRSLRRTWTKGGVGDIQLALAGYGALDVLRRLPARLHRQVEQLLGPPKGSHVWESITPFVPPRFIKPRGRNTLVGQINAELASRDLPEVERLVVDADLTRELRHYVRRRLHGGVPPFADIGFGLRLIFRAPLHGPLVLGYASHYGLGLFAANLEAS